MRGRAPVPSPGRRARARSPRLAAGLFVALLAGWAAFTLATGADRGSRVWVMRHDVPRGATVTAGDVELATVRAPGVGTISSQGAVIGHVANQDLVAGELLAPGLLGDVGGPAVGNGQAVVSVLVSAGLLPENEAVKGARVRLVLPAVDGTSAPDGVNAQILEAAKLTDGARAGDRVLSVVVAVNDANRVAAAAAQGRVSVVVLGS
jgi:SAF domain